MQLKRCGYRASAWLITLLASATVVAAPAQSNDPASAARSDLARFAAYQSQQHGGAAPADFPLSVANLQDLKDARIGTGFPVYTVDRKELLNGRGDLHAMAKPINQWRFIISVHGKPVGMATVESINGHYQTVSYGAAVLANDVESLAARHGNANRSNLRFLRIYQARADFLEVKGDDGWPRYAPLHSARHSLSLTASQAKDAAAPAPLVEAADLLQPLRAAVKANIEAFR